ncbi:MAG: murein hydrolase activator EnvC family protein [Flavobacterium sp.]
MSEKRLKFQNFKRNLFSKRRFIIFNEDTLAETFSWKLTLMNIFVVASLAAILIIFITTFIIAFTPLREYIPGYASTELKRQATALTIKSDSLQRIVDENNQYIKAIQSVLKGDLEYAKLNRDSIKIMEDTSKSVDLSASEKEKELKKQVEKDDKYNVFEKAQPKVGYVLFPPVNGKILKKYNLATKNLGVDLVIAKGTSVKTIAPGIVLFADWTPSNGYVLLVRHADDIISVYKNLASTTKIAGNTVKSGEVLAIFGDDASKKTLHFELWKNGIPIDPTQYINFQ